MKRLLTLTLLYLILLLLFTTGILNICSNIVSNRQFKNYETESNLLVMNENDNYNSLLMGISHARNFSRHKNHLRIEKILNEKILNIGQGEGRCGINEQLFYLDYFYSLGNSSSKVIYVISPPLFFSNTLPIASNTFDREPFEFKFLFNYLLFDSENKQERLISYLQSKFTNVWLNQKPNSKDSKNEKLNHIDNNAVDIGFEMVYQDSLSTKNRYHKSIKRVEETINLAINNNSKVILIIPPALFGKWKGHNEIVSFAKKMETLKAVEFYDFSESILSPEYYYDHHHLNTRGIIYFTDKFLKPILVDDKKLLHSLN
ncbi:hypothetical protein [Flammeovirga sp. EKP202]|uniref:hypothetical protein n=1 Tax=Flammeovirga sp. EKP202 TaxID=2770592 RepID=UPI00165F2437|nr:hypothetical protein [Flammeovirga sp. EKP202]MBD0400816.1 hypothetical protein [Flammeovirga sp. EKP202]